MFKRNPSSERRKRAYAHKRTSIKEEFVDRQIIALHLAIAEKIIAQVEMGNRDYINHVQTVMDERREQGRMHYGEYLTWQSLLEIVDDAKAFKAGLIEDTTQMKKYRRRTPFVGILTETERTAALEKNAVGYLDLV